METMLINIIGYLTITLMVVFTLAIVVGGAISIIKDHINWKAELMFNRKMMEMGFEYKYWHEGKTLYRGWVKVNEEK